VWGKGSLDSRICVFGLAPGLHGANKTGIPFTADFSGQLIREIIEELDFDEYYITNVVRCYPEKNLPQTCEKNNCQIHNLQELSTLRNLRVIVALGEVAYRQLLKLYNIKYNTNKFKHGNIVKLNEKINLISSYHCSKLNINTHKISKDMLKRIFLRAIKLSYYG
tara:strand:+ start:365 stop:859 length:495 start_codon:yes stop_codon:yes gene_type:complete